jgi:ABC-type branched-subunit amino acid transport system substrate-binding protein
MRSKCGAVVGIALGLGLALALLPARGEDIVVSQVSTFSGSQAVTGKAMHAGANLYIDHFNAAGGVKGSRIKLLTRDDAGKPEETVRHVKAAIAEDQPVAFLLTVGTANLDALAKDGALAKAKVPMLGPVSGASSIPKVPEFFTTKASYHDEASRLLYELGTVGINRIGVVYQDDGYGKDVLAGIEAAAQKHGATITAKAPYERNTVKVEAAVAAMLKASPQVVVLAAVTVPASEFFKQFKAQGGTSMIYGVSPIDIQALTSRIGADTARGFAFSRVMPYRSTLPLIREYESLKAKAGQIDGLSARSIEGFVAAKLLVQALRQAERPTREGVMQALQRMRRVDLGDFALDYSVPGRPASNFVDFAVIGEGGRIVQ